jgi:hypothetical protein
LGFSDLLLHRGTAGNPARYNAESLEFLKAADYADFTDAGRRQKQKETDEDSTEDNKANKDSVLPNPRMFVIFVAFW